MKRLHFILAFLLSLSLGVKAGERTDSAAARDAAGGELVVSLLTCAPGPDIYELCGHAALRIRNAEMDSVWNYGIFDFSSPDFLYRFVKGETDYMVRGYEFYRFMPSYVHRGSEVSEQVLDLTQEEAADLRRRLQTEALPQNRVYRYNYVRDNCATRPWKRVTEAAPSAKLDTTLYFSTYREEMRHFHKNYPWYQFGIDLVLGSGLDYPLEPGEDSFAPPVLAEKVARGSIGEGPSLRPLVKETRVIYPGRGDVTLAPTPALLSPMAVGIYVFLISLGACLAWYLKGKKWLWWISLYFAAIGLAGCVVAFLVCFSEHEAVRPNRLIWWLNPLQLIPAVAIWIPRARRLLNWAGWYELVVSIGLVWTLFSAGPHSVAVEMAPWILSLAPLSLIMINKFKTDNSSIRK